MITNEQILKILNTWDVSSASIHDYSDCASLHFIHNNIDVWFSKRMYTSKIEINIELIETDPITKTTQIVYSSIVPEEICLEAAYLVTKKAKDYVKSRLNKIFSNNESNCFDALMND